MRVCFAAGLAAASLASLAAFSAAAHEYRLGALEIGHPYAIESAGKTAAGYFSVTNGGDTADSLIAIRSDFPKTEVHSSETDASGVARMEAVPSVDIPAGATVTLRPGGLHVMFMGLQKPLAVGEHVTATLVFRQAGEIPVDFHVQARGKDGGAMGAMPGMSH